MPDLTANTTTDPVLWARAMQARSYVYAHTHDIADPAAPIWTDGEVHEVPRGQRLYYVDASCPACPATVHIDLGDDATGVPNVVIIAHSRNCPAYWAMLAGTTRRPEPGRLAGFAVTGVPA